LRTRGLEVRAACAGGTAVVDAIVVTPIVSA
jgi:hypothetical protein